MKNKAVCLKINLEWPLSIFMVLSFSFLSFAQMPEDYIFNPFFGKIDLAKDLQKTVLLVPIDYSDSILATNTKKAFEELWTFNKYEFIPANETYKKINDPRYSLFLFYGSTTSKKKSNPNAVVYNYRYGIIIGSSAIKIEKLDYRNIESRYLTYITEFKVPSIFINNQGSTTLIKEKQLSDYIMLIVKALHNDIERSIHRKYSEGKIKSPKGIDSFEQVTTYFYNEGIKSINKKLILIDENDIDESFDKEYFYDNLKANLNCDSIKYQIVNSSFIKTVVDKSDENYLILFDCHEEFWFKKSKNRLGRLYSAKDGTYLAWVSTMNKEERRKMWRNNNIKVGAMFTGLFLSVPTALIILILGQISE